MSKLTATPEDIAIGARLRAVRLQMGLSQEKVGALLDLTFQQVQKYEKGTNRISVSKLLLLAEKIGVDATVFLPITKAVAPVASVEIEAFRRDLRASLKVIDTLAETLGAERAHLQAIEARLASPLEPVAQAA